MTVEKRKKSKEPSEEPFRGMDAVKARQRELELAQRRAIYAIRSSLNFENLSSVEVFTRNIYEYQMNERYAYKFELAQQLRAFLRFIRARMVKEDLLYVSYEMKKRMKLYEDLMLNESETEFERVVNNTQLDELVLEFDYIRDAMHTNTSFLSEIYDTSLQDQRFFDYLGHIDKYSSFTDYVERTTRGTVL